MFRKRFFPEFFFARNLISKRHNTITSTWTTRTRLANNIFVMRHIYDPLWLEDDVGVVYGRHNPADEWKFDWMTFAGINQTDRWLAWMMLGFRHGDLSISVFVLFSFRQFYLILFDSLKNSIEIESYIRDRWGGSFISRLRWRVCLCSGSSGATEAIKLALFIETVGFHFQKEGMIRTQHDI